MGRPEKDSGFYRRGRAVRCRLVEGLFRWLLETLTRWVEGLEPDVDFQQTVG